MEEVERMKRKWPVELENLGRIVAVWAIAGRRVEVLREGAAPTTVDLGPWLESLALAGRLDNDMLSRPKVGEHGASIVWGDEAAELDNMHLWLLEQEQRGTPLHAEAFRRWRARNRLTLDQAADALGLSRRMVGYYESGKSMIPKSIGLACAGWEALHGEEAQSEDREWIEGEPVGRELV
jgi:DNA-binding XRE family transcriptional regulator